MQLPTNPQNKRSKNQARNDPHNTQERDHDATCHEIARPQIDSLPPRLNPRDHAARHEHHKDREHEHDPNIRQDRDTRRRREANNSARSQRIPLRQLRVHLQKRLIHRRAFAQEYAALRTSIRPEFSKVVEAAPAVHTSSLHTAVCFSLRRELCNRSKSIRPAKHRGHSASRVRTSTLHLAL